MGNKRNKKRKGLSQLEVYKGLRKEWKINPKTRIKQSKKKYNRARAKRQAKKEMDDV